jgi:hypothetical protein
MKEIQWFKKKEEKIKFSLEPTHFYKGQVPPLEGPCGTVSPLQTEGLKPQVNFIDFATANQPVVVQNPVLRLSQLQ